MNVWLTEQINNYNNNKTTNILQNAIRDRKLEKSLNKT